LKRVQERGARYQVADELGIPAPPLDDRVCHTYAPEEEEEEEEEECASAPPPLLEEFDVLR
jgi:hypothetical protein